MKKVNTFFCWITSMAFGLGAADPARACAFHGYTPTETLIDILLATEQVVIARQNPSKPDQYLRVETLAGPDVSDIPVTINKDMRALLADTPSSTVLLARDGPYGAWLEIAFLDDRYREFVFKVLRQQSELLLGGDRKRLRMFAELLNDPSLELRRLALQEMDRAPYGDLKDLRLPKIQNLRQDLQSGEADLMPIRVLLAGLSNDRSYSPLLSSGLDTAIHSNVPYLGAYATAMIELEGKRAVKDITERYLKSPTLAVDKQEKLLQAMAIQYKTAPGPVRNLIAREVANVARSSPQIAEAAARQFAFRTRQGLTESDISR